MVASADIHRNEGSSLSESIHIMNGTKTLVAETQPTRIEDSVNAAQIYKACEAKKQVPERRNEVRKKRKLAKRKQNGQNHFTSTRSMIDEN